MLSAARFETDTSFAVSEAHVEETYDVQRRNSSTRWEHESRLSASKPSLRCDSSVAYRQSGIRGLLGSVGPVLTILAAGSMNVTAFSYPQASPAHEQVIRLPAEDRNAELSAEIFSYRSLEEGWDGAGSRSPSADAIRDAIAFIDLIPIGVEPPEPMVSADGDVGFYWKTDQSYIDIVFKGNGTISYFARAGAENPARGAEPFTRSSLPKDLLDVISKI